MGTSEIPTSGSTAQPSVSSPGTASTTFGPCQDASVAATDLTAGDVAQKAIEEAGTSTALGTPPRASPPLPPLFSQQATTDSVFPMLETSAQTLSGTRQEEASHATTPDERAYEEYALSQVHRHINDGLASAGFEPIYQDDNRGIIDGHDVIFLQDRVIITDMQDPEAAKAFVQQLKQKAKDANDQSPDPTIQLLARHKDLIAKLQSDTAHRLPEEEVKKANQAANRVTEQFLQSVTRTAINSRDQRCHPDPLRVITQYRTSHVAQQAITPGSPTQAERKKWTEKQRTTMKKYDWAFRHVLNRKDATPAQPEQPQRDAKREPLPSHVSSQIPLQAAAPPPPVSPAPSHSAVYIEQLKNMLCNPPEDLLNALDTWIKNSEKIENKTGDLSSCLETAKTLRTFMQEQKKFLQKQEVDAPEIQQALETMSELANEGHIALKRLQTLTDSSDLRLSMFYISGYAEKCQQLYDRLHGNSSIPP